jgi:biopolymer transport protein ExbD
MPQAPHSAEISAADDENATVVSITANGKVFVGVRPTELSVLSSLNSSTVYLKADARVPYQEVISVFDALQGKTIVLLTAPASEGKSAGIMPPYGLKINQSGE